MSFDKKYLAWALTFVALGMGLGIFMAASHHHDQLVTHAHILLVGFVVSFIYAVVHKLWLSGNSPRLARTQFLLHQTGAVIMFVGLFLLYGHFVPEATLDSILAVGSIAVFVAAILMIFMVLGANAAKL